MFPINKSNVHTEVSLDMSIVVYLAIFVALGYVVLYFKDIVPRSIDGFKSCKDDNSCPTVLDTSMSQTKPYVTTETSRGDFEQDFVYKNEGGTDTAREAIDMAKRKFPFDWSQLPPDSSLFQAQQAMFAKDPTTKAAPFKNDTYDNIGAIKILPPEEVPDQVATYRPKETTNLTVTDEKDVNKLIQSIYGPKGFIAKVAKKANNVYEIYELEEKNPKIVWEEDLQASIQSNELNSKPETSEMLVSPIAVNDINAGLVGYGAGEKTTLGRREVNDYNPNLEGIFGPKMQWQQYG